MDNKQNEIGKRIQIARKQKGLNQSELAKQLEKSLRTIQKYESGEIEVSIAMINQLANVLDTTSTYLIGHQTNEIHLNSLSDVMEFLFKLENIANLDFSIDVQRPPTHDNWQCSITFNGKDVAANFNADMCLFLENFENERTAFRDYMSSKANYEKWKDKTLAYYAPSTLTVKEEEDLDTNTRLKRRNKILNKKFSNKSEYE